MFRFKRFSISDDRSSMKVGTDGVLLGAWCTLDSGVKRVLDIGTGSGLIALMVAQRNEDCNVDGAEIESESAQQAAENFAASEWGDRVKAIHTDIKEFEVEQKYDLVVTNPPYFVDSLTSPDAGRTLARHTTELSFAELIQAVIRVLKPGGLLSVILPPNETQLFDIEISMAFVLVRRCAVFGRTGLAPKRYMSEYVLSTVAREICEEEITIERENRGEYSDEYRELTREFYLKF